MLWYLFNMATHVPSYFSIIAEWVSGDAMICGWQYKTKICTSSKHQMLLFHFRSPKFELFCWNDDDSMELRASFRDCEFFLGMYKYLRLFASFLITIWALHILIRNGIFISYFCNIYENLKCYLDKHFRCPRVKLNVIRCLTWWFRDQFYRNWASQLTFENEY